jgi:hypothetical protein
MSKALASCVIMAALVAAGCVTQTQFLDDRQAMAVQTAVSRGQFELNCPAATGTVSRKRSFSPFCRVPG